MRPRAPQTCLHTEPPPSFPAAHHLDLGLDLDAKPPLDLGHHALDETKHVGGFRATFIDDEVAVQGGDDGRTLSRSFQAGPLDQTAGGTTAPDLERAAADLGLDGLCL